MPSPFNRHFPDESVKPGIIDITNSTLICDVCFVETAEGEYEVEAKRLSFVCVNGHINIVRNIEI